MSNFGAAVFLAFMCGLSGGIGAMQSSFSMIAVTVITGAMSIWQFKLGQKDYPDA